MLIIVFVVSICTRECCFVECHEDRDMKGEEVRYTPYLSYNLLIYSILHTSYKVSGSVGILSVEFESSLASLLIASHRAARFCTAFDRVLKMRGANEASLDLLLGAICDTCRRCRKWCR